MNFGGEEIIIVMLGLIVGLLGYWAVRLENQVQDLKLTVYELREQIPAKYLSKDDFKERWRELLDSLGTIEAKLDRLHSFK